MSDTTFIYGLTDPDTGKIRYIGKSNNPIRRWEGHLIDADVWTRPHCRTSGTPKQLWIKGLLNQDMQPDLVIIEGCLISKWREREDYWIHTLVNAGYDLVNTDCAGRFYKSTVDNS